MNKLIKTKDTYEASFYLMFGGELVKFETKRVRENKREKLGYRTQYYFYIDCVPDWCIDTFRSGMAFGHINEFIRQRKKLKAYIRKVLT